MKKLIYLSLSFVMVLSILFFASEQPVLSAAWAPTPEPKDAGPANGDWVAKTEGVTGSSVQVPATLPNEWSRLQSKGFAVSGRTEICHPFRGGQFGWHTSVFLLEGKSWTKLPTTVEWYPDEEGQLMACAFAPVSGTYAMFGYWEWFEGFEKPVVIFNAY